MIGPSQERIHDLPHLNACESMDQVLARGAVPFLPVRLKPLAKAEGSRLA
jgi:hypothetical protein